MKILLILGLPSDSEEEDEDDSEQDLKEPAKVRMPYQDTPDAPLDISSDYFVEHSAPSFAIPPSMRRVTDASLKADGKPFFTPFNAPTKKSNRK